jgi:hypothetical protein
MRLLHRIHCFLLFLAGTVTDKSVLAYYKRHLDT